MADGKIICFRLPDKIIIARLWEKSTIKCPKTGAEQQAFPHCLMCDYGIWRGKGSQIWSG